MKFLVGALLSLLITGTSFADDDTKCVENLMKARLDAVASVVQKNDSSRQERDSRVLEIIEPVFDFSKMAKLTLGRKHWSGLSKEKKEEFSNIFIKRLKASYLDKLNLYTDEKIVYKTPVKIKKKVHFPIELISKDNLITMLYKFYKSKSGWKVYDVEVQGVSIILTYRSQFDQVMSDGNIDDLILKLKEMKTENTTALNSTKNNE